MANAGPVALFKALLAVVDGAEIERRGLDAADDPHGYAGSPGTRGRGGAYFATAAALALRHVRLRDYRNGLLVVTLPRTDYDALCASGGVLPDTLHAARRLRGLQRRHVRAEGEPPPRPRRVHAPHGRGGSLTPAGYTGARWTAHMTRLEPDQVVHAKVVATAGHGLHLDYQGVEILVHAADCPWGHEISPEEYAKVGDELDVKILRVVDDGQAATGWLPFPRPAKAKARASGARTKAV